MKSNYDYKGDEWTLFDTLIFNQQNCQLHTPAARRSFRPRHPRAATSCGDCSIRLQIDIGSKSCRRDLPFCSCRSLHMLSLRRAARRGQGGRLTTLNFRPGAVTTLNLGHVSIFYQVIFPVNKQGSIESPPRKQRLENDAKEREKQTIVAKKTVSRPNNASSDRRSLQTFHRKQSVFSKFHQMWGRQSRHDTTGHIVSRLQKRFTL